MINAVLLALYLSPDMWLLNTTRAELHYFVNPERVPGGYAILSHVWDPPNEQSFHDIQDLCAQCSREGTNPRYHISLSDKIRECCKFAKADGYDWVWIDTCCIDKSSSAELSEAINSMFRYYSLAEICYAYLADVETVRKDVLWEWRSAFRESKWFTRGWTLQELLAPPTLVVLSKSWEPLGTKAELAELLGYITGIPITVLRCEETLDDVSIARRMSWAATRVTTRLEDEAYCLMGIFGVNMPTLYGEGRRAFRRLQEEIMQHTVDTSLFAWGPSLKFLKALFEIAEGDTGHGDLSYMLAPSPSSFRDSMNIRCALHDRRDALSPSREVAVSPFGLVINIEKAHHELTQNSSGGQHHLPTFSMTPYGMRIHLPVIETIDDYLLAVLFSYDDCSDEPTHLALCLTPCVTSRLSQSSYCIGLNRPSGTYRVAHLKGDLKTLQFNAGTAHWRDVYVAHYPESNAPGSEVVGHDVRLLNARYSSPFHFRRSSLRLLDEGYSFHLPWLVSESRPWAYDPRALKLTFRKSHAGQGQSKILLHLGACAFSSTLWAQFSLRELYGRDLWGECLTSQEAREHDCGSDHISSWPGLAKTIRYFSDSKQELGSVTLFFTTGPTYTTQSESFVVNISKINRIGCTREKFVETLVGDCPSQRFRKGVFSYGRTPAEYMSFQRHEGEFQGCPGPRENHELTASTIPLVKSSVRSLAYRLPPTARGRGRSHTCPAGIRLGSQNSW